MRERKKCGSALKFGVIAAGEADFYPRFGTTMEWDTAAGQAVLEAAGGRVETSPAPRSATASPASRTTASSPGAAEADRLHLYVHSYSAITMVDEVVSKLIRLGQWQPGALPEARRFHCRDRGAFARRPRKSPPT